MEPQSGSDSPINQPPKLEPDTPPTAEVTPGDQNTGQPAAAPLTSVVPDAGSVTAVPVTMPESAPAVPSAPVISPDVSPAAPVQPATPFAAEPTAVAAATVPATPPASPVVMDGQGSQPSVVGAPVTGNGPRRSRKKLFLFGGLAALVILLLAGGWVFGMYLPNKPENVWKTGLDRTGQALDKIIGDATSTQNVDKLKTSELSGDFSYKAKDSGAISGDFSVKLNDTDSDSSASVTFKPDGESAHKLSAKVLTTKPDKDTTYPDVYFQLTGFKDLGLDGFVPGISKYDGKWIALPSDYLSEQLSDITDTPENDDETLTTAEATEAVKAVTAVTREYIFTSDPTKAVIVNKGFKQKETVDGVATYHYTAGFDRAHGEKFCVALGDTIANTRAFKKSVAEDERADQKKSIIDGCKDGFKNIKDSDTFDLWVDAHYKLIYKIRIYDEENDKNYLDVGQHYTGGDDVKLFMKVHDEDEKVDASTEMTLNFKDYSIKGSAAMETKSSDGPFTFNMNFSGKASNDKVNVTKPSGAVNIKDVLKDLGVDPTPAFAPTDTTLSCDDNPYAGACGPQSDDFRVN